jgi:hypothetical protein
MAFLDWMKNRQASQQQPVAQNTQKQKAEAPTQKRVDQMPPEQKAKEEVTPDKDARAPSAAPSKPPETLPRRQPSWER